MVPASVGVSAGLQEDLGTLQVSVDHGHVQGRLSLHVHQVHLGALPDEEVHAVAVAGSGRDAQGRAGQPAAAPHRLLVDAATTEHRTAGAGGRSTAACCPVPTPRPRDPEKEGRLLRQSPFLQ